MLGLFLILIGILSLLIACIDHMKRLLTMKRLGLQDPSPMNLPLVGAGVLFTIGVVTLVGLFPGVVS